MEGKARRSSSLQRQYIATLWGRPRDSGVTARSLRPVLLPLTEFCGPDFVSEDLPRQAHREIISETPKFSPFINIFRN